MKSIRIKNLRSLEDTKNIDIKPITLLVGKNGSGKSTFARFFMLLRQSIESRTKGPLLWYGDHVDFGSFEESINKNSTNKRISFSFEIPLVSREYNKHPFFSPLHLPIINDCMADVELSVKCTKENKTYLHNIKILTNEDIIDLTFDKKATLTNFHVNEFDIMSIGTKYESFEKPGFLPIVKPAVSSQSEKMQRHYFEYFPKDFEIIKLIAKDLSYYCHGKVKTGKIQRIAYDLPYGDKESFLDHLKKLKTLGRYYSQTIKSIKTNNKTINKIRSFVLASTITKLLIVLDDYISNTALSISYIEPVRAGIIRFYREQDLSVAEIDPEGKNLPMFLRNLTESERKEFCIWTRKNLGFEVKPHSRHGQIALHLTEEGSSNDYNLADMGFGFSQILPIVAQLWILVGKDLRTRHDNNLPRILSIEQPELHLHPDYQAKVADMFVAAIDMAKRNKVDLRLVIETHSETIINRIGNLIYKKRLNKNEASVVLFEKRHADRSAEVSVSGYDEEGCLQNWPYGFFQPEEG